MFYYNIHHICKTATK